jgi:hypothetical protein
MYLLGSKRRGLLVLHLALLLALDWKGKKRPTRGAAGVGTMAVGEAGEGRCRQPDVKHHPNPSPAWRLTRTRKEREVDGKGKRTKRHVHNEWQAGNYEEL